MFVFYRQMNLLNNAPKKIKISFLKLLIFLKKWKDPIFVICAIITAAVASTQFFKPTKESNVYVDPKGFVEELLAANVVSVPEELSGAKIENGVVVNNAQTSENIASQQNTVETITDNQFWSAHIATHTSRKDRDAFQKDIKKRFSTLFENQFFLQTSIKSDGDFFYKTSVLLSTKNSAIAWCKQYELTGFPCSLVAIPLGNPIFPGKKSAWVVQVSSQRSAEEAQASFANMRSRFSILRGRSMSIQRATVNEATYYRVRVQTKSRKDANQLCSKLIQQGGNCFVTR